MATFGLTYSKVWLDSAYELCGKEWHSSEQCIKSCVLLCADI